MRTASWAWMAIALCAAPSAAAEDSNIVRLATCQDSWLDWSKGDPEKLKKFAGDFRSNFSRNGNDPFFVPKSRQTVAGLRVTQAFPDSVGMGVGFSVVVDAGFDKARQSLEKLVGRSLGHCGVGDDMRSCELEIAEKRTLVLMAQDDAKRGTALLGCYYYYEK